MKKHVRKYLIEKEYHYSQDANPITNEEWASYFAFLNRLATALNIDTEHNLFLNSVIVALHFPASLSTRIKEKLCNEEPLDKYANRLWQPLGKGLVIRDLARVAFGDSNFNSSAKDWIEKAAHILDYPVVKAEQIVRCEIELQLLERRLLRLLQNP